MIVATERQKRASPNKRREPTASFAVGCTVAHVHSGLRRRSDVAAPRQLRPIAFPATTGESVHTRPSRHARAPTARRHDWPVSVIRKSRLIRSLVLIRGVIVSGFSHAPPPRKASANTPCNNASTTSPYRQPICTKTSSSAELPLMEIQVILRRSKANSRARCLLVFR